MPESGSTCCALDELVGHRMALVFGAGKVGRGFITHLLRRAGWRVHLIDADPELVARINERGRYRIHLLDVASTCDEVHHVSASHIDDTFSLGSALRRADLVFTSIGANHLKAWAERLATPLAGRLMSGPLDLILCENHARPAALVRETLERMVDPECLPLIRDQLGIAQAQVLRSCIEATEAQRDFDPLAVQAQDHWVLPLDAEALRRPEVVADVTGLEPRPEFEAELTRKLYTYNAINAVVCYLGHLLGHEWLADAANHPGVLEMAVGAGGEASRALVAGYGFDIRDQAQWVQRAVAKYRDHRLTDPIERNARDPIRKLGPEDRLLGPLRLALSHGLDAPCLALSTVAALRYSMSDDSAFLRLQAEVARLGAWPALAALLGDAATPELEAAIRAGEVDLAAFLAEHQVLSPRR